jgi:hypothetical protein
MRPSLIDTFLQIIVRDTIPQLNTHYNNVILGSVETHKLNQPNTKYTIDDFHTIVKQFYSWYFKYEALQLELNENDPRHYYIH